MFSRTTTKSMSSSPWLGTQGLDAGVAHDRPEVHVLIELEPDLQQQVALQDAGLHARVADRARGRSASISRSCVELLVGEHIAGAQEPIGAEVEVDQRHVEVARTASSTLRPSATTSGPVPSPRMTPIVWPSVTG